MSLDMLNIILREKYSPEFLSDRQLRKELVYLKLADNIKSIRHLPRYYFHLILMFFVCLRDELISRLTRARAWNCMKLPFRYTYGVTIRCFSRAEELSFLTNDQILNLCTLFKLRPPKLMELTFFRPDSNTRFQLFPLIVRKTFF